MVNSPHRWRNRITATLWLLAFYLLILYVVFRMGGHPGGLRFPGSG